MTVTKAELDRIIAAHDRARHATAADCEALLDHWGKGPTPRALARKIATARPQRPPSNSAGSRSDARRGN